MSVTPPTEVSREKQNERDRFVGFAFAGADLLIQVSPSGTISFVTGACNTILGVKPAELLGATIADYFDPIYQPTLNTLIQAKTLVGRRGPVQMRTATERPVDLSLCRLPQTQSDIFVSLSRRQSLDRPFSEGGKDAFLDITSSIAKDLDREAAITMISLDVEGIAQEPDRAAIQNELDHAVGALLCANALPQRGAASFGDGNYGLLHAIDSDAEYIVDQLADLARAVHPNLADTEIQSETISTVELGTDGDRAKQVMKRVIDDLCIENLQIADKRDMGSLMKSSLAETTDRMEWLANRVSHREFDLHLQPIVDLQTGRIAHYESLCRFEPNKSPYELITFAEDVALVLDLDRAVMDTAFDILNTPTLDRSVGLSVNVSGLSIQSERFVEQIESLYRAEPNAHGRLVLEITESAKIENLEPVRHAVDSLRAQGITICLDDFGAGAASFPYLHALNVDCVKIDGVYIARMLQDSRDYFMIKALADLCRNLGIVTVAEYVEEEPQAKALQQLGIAQAQGFLYGKPVPLAECTATEISGHHFPGRDAEASTSVTRLNLKRKGFTESWG